MLELFESPASAPPPEVLGPQGKSLFRTRLRTTSGVAIRQFISAAQPPPDKNARTPVASPDVSGISIELRPTVGKSGIATDMVVDTNLPIGATPAAGAPRWVRATLKFSVQPGETHYVTESELAKSLKQGASTPARTGSGGGSVIGDVVGTAAGRAASDVPGGEYIPAIGGIFRRRGGGTSKKTNAKAEVVDESVLVIVVTPLLATATAPE